MQLADFSASKARPDQKRLREWIARAAASLCLIVVGAVAFGFLT